MFQIFETLCVLVLGIHFGIPKKNVISM